MLFWLCAVMFSVATSCTIASRPTVTCSASDGKADSSETHTEVVESNKRFVVSVVFFWSWHSLFTFHMQDFHVSACELMQNDLCSEIAIKIDNKVLIAVVFHVSLQCFDTVGWVTGRASSL